MSFGLYSGLTSSWLSLCRRSFSSISRSSSCSFSRAPFRGPHRRVYSTMAMVYWTRMPQSSLLYLALAMVIPLAPSGEGVRFLAAKLVSKYSYKRKSIHLIHFKFNIFSPRKKWNIFKWILNYSHLINLHALPLVGKKIYSNWLL